DLGARVHYRDTREDVCVLAVHEHADSALGPASHPSYRLLPVQRRRLDFCAVCRGVPVAAARRADGHAGVDAVGRCRQPFRAGPLEGIRVADFTWVWAGPTCTMQLAHMGAEVIRMESMRRVCTLRMLPPWPDGQPGVNRSGYFNQYNQGKRSIQLDISKPDGVEIAKQIVAMSDVAVENFAS